jgi:hypothetical protein
MINQGNDVPDKTIVIFSDNLEYTSERVSSIIQKPGKIRRWFTSRFYKCLPLVTANEYGFVVKSEFDFGFVWNGGDSPDDLKILVKDEIGSDKIPHIVTHFGSGIITLNVPFTLRTPPGVNLLVTGAPNYILSNLTAMTAVVETDNLRRNFTINLKVAIPNLEVWIPAGTPLAGLIPIPRYYADKFELKLAEDVFDEETVNEELQASIDAGLKRQNVELNTPSETGRDYLTGRDVYGNVFPDHQGP